jgi:hypothetical protein
MHVCRPISVQALYAARPVCTSALWSFRFSDSIVAHPRNHPSFLLSTRYFVRGTMSSAEVFLFAANRNIDSIRLMIDADSSDSKLCACATRHATVRRLSATAVAQLGKGRTLGPPRCIPSCALRGATETVPVSEPFGFTRAAVAHSWRQHP